MMSMKKLVERLNSDTAFAEKYAKLGSPDELIGQAKADGFEVTKEDVQAYVKSFSESALSDEDAAAVAGGKKQPSRAMSILGGAGSLLMALGQSPCATMGPNGFSSCK
jgi:predicted ribosomally synthesized peptide with nif11-like leader